jgi:hypothetical protein
VWWKGISQEFEGWEMILSEKYWSTGYTAGTSKIFGVKRSSIDLVWE